MRRGSAEAAAAWFRWTAGLTGDGSAAFAAAGVSQVRAQNLFELLVGVDLDGIVFRIHRSARVFAEIETRLRDGNIGGPFGGARVSLFPFGGFGSRGHQAQALRPVESQFILREIGGIAVMRIPAFARADKQNAVARVLNHVAAVAEIKGEI